MRINVTKLKAKGLEKIPVASLLDKKGQLLQMQPVTVVSMPKPGTGIKETIEAVEFIAAVTNVIYGFVIKGFTSLGWIAIVWSLIPLARKAVPAIKGIGNIPSELNDLTAEEKNEVLEALKDH